MDYTMDSIFAKFGHQEANISLHVYPPSGHLKN